MFSTLFPTVTVPCNRYVTARPPVGRHLHALKLHPLRGCADLTLRVFWVFLLPKLMFVDVLLDPGLGTDRVVRKWLF